MNESFERRASKPPGWIFSRRTFLKGSLVALAGMALQPIRLSQAGATQPGSMSGQLTRANIRTGYVVRPAGKSDAAGVVLVPEWNGVTDGIRSAADRLANAGFAVFVPALYDETTDDPQVGRQLIQATGLTNAVAKLNRAIETLQQSEGIRADRIGLLGFSTGSQVVIATTAHAHAECPVALFYGGEYMAYPDRAAVGESVVLDVNWNGSSVPQHPRTLIEYAWFEHTPFVDRIVSLDAGWTHTIRWFDRMLNH